MKKVKLFVPMSLWAKFCEVFLIQKNGFKSFVLNGFQFCTYFSKLLEKCLECEILNSNTARKLLKRLQYQGRWILFTVASMTFYRYPDFNKPFHPIHLYSIQPHHHKHSTLQIVHIEHLPLLLKSNCDNNPAGNYMFKVNNKDTRTTAMTLFWYLYC